MDYKVILSRPALQDLGEIARYIAGDNPSAAERVGEELLRLAESLTLFPRSGGQLKSRPGVRRLVHDPYLITYRVDEIHRVVFILRFWHAKRDPESWHMD